MSAETARWLISLILTIGVTLFVWAVPSPKSKKHHNDEKAGNATPTPYTEKDIDDKTSVDKENPESSESVDADTIEVDKPEKKAEEIKPSAISKIANRWKSFEFIRQLFSIIFTIITFITLVFTVFVVIRDLSVPTNSSAQIPQDSYMEDAIAAGEALNNERYSTAVFTKSSDDNVNLGNVFTIKYTEDFGGQKINKTYFVTTFKSLLNVFNNNKNFKIKFKDEYRADITSSNLNLVGYSPLYNIAILEVNADSGDFSTLSLAQQSAKNYDEVEILSDKYEYTHGAISKIDSQNPLTSAYQYLTDIFVGDEAGVPVIDEFGLVTAITTGFTDENYNAVLIPGFHLENVLNAIPSLESFPVEELPEWFPYNYYKGFMEEYAKIGLFDTTFTKTNNYYRLENTRLSINKSETGVTLTDKIYDTRGYTDAQGIHYMNSDYSVNPYHFSFYLRDNFFGLYSDYDEKNYISYNFNDDYITISNNDQTEKTLVNGYGYQIFENGKFTDIDAVKGTITDRESGEAVELPEHITYIPKRNVDVASTNIAYYGQTTIYPLENEETKIKAGLVFDNLYYISDDSLYGFVEDDYVFLKKHEFDNPFHNYITDNMTASISYDWGSSRVHAVTDVPDYFVMRYENSPLSEFSANITVGETTSTYTRLNLNSNGLVATAWDNCDIVIHDSSYNDNRVVNSIYYDAENDWIYVGGMDLFNYGSTIGIIMNEYGFLVGVTDTTVPSNVNPFALNYSDTPIVPERTGI
ncbi:MAG: hypothetical protein LBL98_02210 [Ruminococcus sp.]|nr:hypothetical protein [Ruminococcus sp.]